MDLKIKKIETKKSKIPQKHLMEQNIIPKHPMRAMFSGASGSGKTNLMVNLMTRDQFYKGYFDKVYFFSPTFDDLAEKLNLPKEQIFNDLDPADIEAILNEQDADIKKNGIENSPKILLIFEDVIQDTKFLNSKAFKRVYFAGRHSNISSMIMTQSYNQVPRKLRLQITNAFIFPATKSEEKIIIEEYTPPGMDKKTFAKILHKATDKRFNFLHINNFADPKEKFRKNLDVILQA